MVKEDSLLSLTILTDFFQIAVFDSFCYWFLIKFLKRYLSCGSIVSNYKSRVLIDPC